MIQEITIPEIGEKIESGQVVSILVKAGDIVKADQTVMEFETDKAVVEIPSSTAGRITELLVKEGDTVRIGQAIARVDTDAETEASPPVPGTEPEMHDAPQSTPRPRPQPQSEPGPYQPPPVPSPRPAPPHAVDPDGEVVHQSRRAEDVPAAPSVRRLARELGADIRRVPGSGPGGRVSMDDVKRFVQGVVSTGGATGPTTSAPAASPAGQPAAPVYPEPALPDFGFWGPVRREAMSRVRAITAESMSRAWRTVPHVTQFDKADVTELERFRKQYGSEVERFGGKLTLTAMILRVVAAALKKYPKFNASIDVARNEIVYKDYVHIGIAVDTDRGLLVPVIRDVDRKNLRQLSRELSDIAERARQRKITPDELDGGTFTISNQGGIGGVDFTPIVYWPQVAILGMSRASIQPVWDNGQFVPRLILPLSLSYDHRIIDGAEAARFLDWVVKALQQPMVLQLENEG